MEILSGVHRIANAVSAAYLLVDERDGLTLIDTGPGRFDRTVLAYLGKIGRRPDKVRRIILTHRHFDHMGGAARLRAATGARVWAHPLDIPQIDGSERNRLPKGIMGMALRVVQPIAFPLKPCPVDETLADGQRLDGGGSLGKLQVIHTPGHTGGHCSLLLPSRRLLILGDALNNFNGTPQVSFDAVNDDTPQARRTVIALGDLPDIDALVFGHGNPILRDGSVKLREAAQRTKKDVV